MENEDPHDTWEEYCQELYNMATEEQFMVNVSGFKCVIKSIFRGDKPVNGCWNESLRTIRQLIRIMLQERR